MKQAMKDAQEHLEEEKAKNLALTAQNEKMSVELKDVRTSASQLG